MYRHEIEELLARVADGTVDPATAARRLDVAPVAELACASLDMTRAS